MRHYSQSVITTAYKVAKKLIGVECDICNGIIPVNPKPNVHNQYFKITTGHRDWGNDSCESRETVDVCPGCVAKFISDYLTDCSDTAYLDLETKVVWEEPTREYVDHRPKDGETVAEDYGW